MELHGLDVLEPALLPRSHETAVLILLPTAVPLLPLRLTVSPGAARVLRTVIIPTLAFVLPGTPEANTKCKYASPPSHNITTITKAVLVCGLQIKFYTIANII